MRILRFLFTLLGIGLIVALAGEPVRAEPSALTMNVSRPYCVQASPPSGACFINVSSFSASTPDSTFARIEISIDGKVRLRMQSFFENSAYLTYLMMGEGLKVTCGGPNASGVRGVWPGVLGQPDRIYHHRVACYGYCKRDLSIL